MKKHFLLIVISGLLFATGCASMRASQAYHQTRNTGVSQHTYALGCDKVLPVARQMLFEEGYSVKDSDENTLTIETEWRGNEQDSGATRYLVQGLSPGQDQCQLSIMKGEGDAQSYDTVRDTQMEWDVLKKLDSKSAAEIEQKAKAAEVAAKQQ